jgi:uncharacterized membrane protein HdeD (DUF308 family)
MRIITIVLATLLGCYMLFNGIFELLTNRLFAEEHIPRPWMGIVNGLGLNIVALGPIFIVWGTAWFYFAYLLLKKERNAYVIGLCISLLTLLYFPFGSAIAVATIGLLRSNKKPSGLLR